MRTRSAALAIPLSFTAAAALAQDYVLTITDTGLREYYCQITVELENKTDEQLTEISGYFYSYIGTEKVGRSKGAWFMNVPPGGTATATFETPNAPCDDVERHAFMVGACRFDAGFADKAECAARIGGTGTIEAMPPS